MIIQTRVTYVSVGSRRQVLALDGIIVETNPLGKGLFDVLLVFRVVPVEHVGGEGNASLFAKSLNNLLGVVQQVIGINDCDGNLVLLLAVAIGLAVGGVTIHLTIGMTVGVAIGVAIGTVGVAIGGSGHLGTLRHGWSNNALLPKIVKQDAELRISSLVHHEVLEARHIIQRRNGAAVERGDAAPRVTDEECKMVLLHHVQRQHRGVAGLSRTDALGVSIGDALLDTVGRVTIGFVIAERRSNCCGLSIRCHYVICHILDEDALSLLLLSI
jgi:hypothetical protein